MPATTFNGRTFDRNVHFDPQSRMFGIAEHVSDQPMISHDWDCPIDLDQGQDGACVGFGWTHWEASQPCSKTGLTYDTAMTLYHMAQSIDGDPDPHEGSTVLAGAKIVQQANVISSYRWAFSRDDLVLALGYIGPVVLGVNWHEDMFNPDAKNMITPTGNIVGGHCILARAINLTDGFDVGSGIVTLHNSWGPSWGNSGDAYITVNDLWALLQDQGEACIPVVAAATPVVV